MRIWGIDAPEGLQACEDAAGRSYGCGQVARDRLNGFIGGAPVVCEVRDHDGHRRAVSRCRAGGRDLGEMMVRAGWAVDYVQFSHGAYATAEGEARRGRRGVWAVIFEPPAAWRAGARLASAAPAARTPTGCRIKGNINAKGRRIFHAPGQRDYDATSIDTRKGERWFCSAAEARGAGWTPAQR